MGGKQISRADQCLETKIGVKRCSVYMFFLPLRDFGTLTVHSGQAGHSPELDGTASFRLSRVAVCLSGVSSSAHHSNARQLYGQQRLCLLETRGSSPNPIRPHTPNAIPLIYPASRLISKDNAEASVPHLGIVPPNV